MPDYDFSLVALTATGAEPVRWSLTENVTSVVNLPLWGRRLPDRLRAGSGGVTRGRRSPRR